MKSKNLLFALATSALLLASCGNDPVSSSGSVNPASSDEAITSKVTSSEAPLSSPSSESSEASSESSSTDPGAAKRIVRIAYHNDDNSMDKLAIYAWGEGTSGKEYAWDGMLNENFAYKDFDMDEEPMKYASGNNFFFIIKKPNTWAGQSNDTKVDLSSYTYEAQADGSKILTVYANDGGGGVIETHKTMKEAMGASISKFEIDPSLTKFNFASTEAPYYVRLYIFDETFYDLSSAKKSDPDTYESYRIWEKVGGIEPATAKALVAKYDALSKASDGDSNWYAKEYVDATTVWTYSSDSDNEDNIRYGDIVGGLRLLAAKDTLPTLNVDVSNSNVTAAVITFATLGVGMAGVAAYIFTRKKKKFED